MAKDTNTSGRPGIQARLDDKGRITERTVRLGAAPDAVEVRRYAYDAAGRLSRVTDGQGRLCESYLYDREARRLADINPQRFTGERRYSYSLGNRLGQAGSVQYGHDAAGFRNRKVAGRAETRYDYEPSGLLLGVDLPDGRRIDYAYDANGLRTEKRVNGRPVAEYIWLDALRLGAFFDGRQWWRLVYDPKGQSRSPVGVDNGHERYLILTDQVGTPLALAHPDGVIVQAMQYDSFGNLLGVRGEVAQLPLGFAGGLFDADTGLTRFVWRDYDADTGRFTALDPLRDKGGDPDWYGYCVDDPVNRVDVWGLDDSGILTPTGSPEYNDCMSDARWWKRQCRQGAEFLDFAIGTKWPMRGYSVGKVGDWACEKIYDFSTEKCEEKYGQQRLGEDVEGEPGAE